MPPKPYRSAPRAVGTSRWFDSHHMHSEPTSGVSHVGSFTFPKAHIWCACETSL